MATSSIPATPLNNGQTNQNVCNTGNSPSVMSTPIGSNIMGFQTMQNGQSYVMPPVYQYPQYTMNPNSPG